MPEQMSPRFQIGDEITLSPGGGGPWVVTAIGSEVHAAFCGDPGCMQRGGGLCPHYRVAVRPANEPPRRICDPVYCELRFAKVQYVSSMSHPCKHVTYPRCICAERTHA